MILRAGHRVLGKVQFTIAKKMADVQCTFYENALRLEIVLKSEMVFFEGQTREKRLSASLC